MSGFEELAAAISITFRADLTEFVRTRPGVLHWLFGPVHRGALIAYLPDRLWTYGIAMPPGTIDMAAFSGESVEELIRAALGPEAAHVPFDVIAVTPWTVRAQVADAYRVGSVLLAGDAAHRFPPFGRSRPQHRPAGRAQPRVEAGRGARRLGHGGALGELRARAPARRTALL